MSSLRRAIFIRWRWSNVPAHVTARVERVQRCFCPLLRTEAARRGREHFVDYERSEIIYLVIRDSIPPSPPKNKSALGAFFLFLFQNITIPKSLRQSPLRQHQY